VAAEWLGYTRELWDAGDATWTEALEADLLPLLRAWGEVGLEALVTSVCDPESLTMTRAMLENLQAAALLHPQSLPRVLVSIGCHPKTAGLFANSGRSKAEEQLENFLRELRQAADDPEGPLKRSLVAWGECGLDYSHPQFGKDPWNQEFQHQAFVAQIREAQQRNLPLVVHSRDAEVDTVKILEAELPRDAKAHMHAFMGGVAWMERLLEGFPNLYFGMTGTVTNRLNTHLHDLARICPLARMLLETDAPWLAPRGSEGGLSNPSQAAHTAAKVAELKGLPSAAGTEEVLRRCRKNARFVYGI
jgi:TatD DNase family protein